MKACPPLLLSALLLLPTPSASEAPAPRHLLERQAAAVDLAPVLATADAFRPYPTIADRAAWAALPEARRKAFIAEAERQLTTEWATLPASRFLDYVRDGDRGRYEKLLFSRRGKLALLVLGELLEDEGRFTDAIADGTWLICEESYWGVPAHMGAHEAGSGLPDVTEPTVDLFAAETGALLAWTDYLMGERLDAVHPLVRERLRLEVDRRILTPNLERDDFWWMGLGPREVNNWNPWINSNWLASVLLLERDPERRVRAVRKIARSLDRFVDAYPDDGGCDEGPSYWGRAGASLFESLELLHAASGGRLDVYRESVVRAIGQYIARAYIAGEYYVNIGDAPAKVRPEPELVFRYGRATGCGALRLRGLPRRAPGALRPGRRPALRQPRPRPAGAPGGGGPRGDGPGRAARRRRVAPRPPDDGRPRGARLVAGALRRGVGRAQRAEPQPQRRRQCRRVRRRDARPHRRRRGEVHVEDLQLPAVRDLDDAVGLSQPAGGERPRPAGRGGVRGARRHLRGRSRRRALLPRHRAGVAARGEGRALAARGDARPEEARGRPRRGLRARGGPRARPAPLRDAPRARRLDARPRRARPPGRGGVYVLVYDARRFTAGAEEKAIADPRLLPVWGERLFRVVLTARDRAVRGAHRIVVRRAP